MIATYISKANSMLQPFTSKGVLLAFISFADIVRVSYLTYNKERQFLPGLKTRGILAED